MKKLFYSLTAVALLSLTACDSDDDGFYNTVYVQSQDLMYIGNPSANYSVGESIEINSIIDRFIDEPGQTEPLDILQTTGADQFQFSYLLEKRNAGGEWEVVDVTGHHDEVIGDAAIGFFIQGLLDYNEITEQYRYQANLELWQTGQFRLNFSNNTEHYNKVFFNSLSPGNNIVLNIFSTSDSVNSSGVFEFTVN